MLHFPKLNVSVWFDGSEKVGLEHWGYRDPKWCMRIPPADWQPMPSGYRQEAEQVWLCWQAVTGGPPGRAGHFGGVGERPAETRAGEAPLAALMLGR